MGQRAPRGRGRERLKASASDQRRKGRAMCGQRGQGEGEGNGAATLRNGLVELQHQCVNHPSDIPSVHLHSCRKVKPNLSPAQWLGRRRTTPRRRVRLRDTACLPCELVVLRCKRHVNLLHRRAEVVSKRVVHFLLSVAIRRHARDNGVQRRCLLESKQHQRGLLLRHVPLLRRLDPRRLRQRLRHRAGQRRQRKRVQEEGQVRRRLVEKRVPEVPHAPHVLLLQQRRRLPHQRRLRRPRLLDGGPQRRSELRVVQRVVGVVERLEVRRVRRLVAAVVVLPLPLLLLLPLLRRLRRRRRLRGRKRQHGLHDARHVARGDALAVALTHQHGLAGEARAAHLAEVARKRL
eukprot:Rhum_TRINITY_DN25651_c0_g1::Rhum_TRINITY_DN25651_c0_g1_i1::g.182549::m.182549